MPSRQRRRAFTLLELMIVLVLVALVASRAVLVWSGTYHGARFESALGRIEFLDQHARRDARLHGRPYELVIDTKGHRIGRTTQGRRGEKLTWEPLPRGVEIKQLKIVGARVRSAKQTLRFDRGGVAASYGLHLEGPGERRAWLVVAGVSGQVVPLENERAFHETLAALSGPDAG